MYNKKIKKFIKATTASGKDKDYAEADKVLQDIIADKVKERYDRAYEEISSKIGK
jgi:hypothetical protein